MTEIGINLLTTLSLINSFQWKWLMLIPHLMFNSIWETNLLIVQHLPIKRNSKLINYNLEEIFSRIEIKVHYPKTLITFFSPTRPRSPRKNLEVSEMRWDSTISIRKRSRIKDLSLQSKKDNWWSIIYSQTLQIL